MEILRTENICKVFRGVTAVDNVSLAAYEGQITGLIGANGAGKTTLFNCISGFYHATSGKVLFKGQEVQHKSSQHLCQMGMARTFQIARPFGNLSVIDNVAVGGYNRGVSKEEAYKSAREALEFTGLASKAENFAFKLNTGEQRQLELARALATKPELLLLDEVMAGLTPTESREMIKLIRKIRENGKSIIMIEHIMPVVMGLSDRIYVLEQGKLIAEGNPEEVSNNQRVIESYIGRDEETEDA